MAEPDSGDYRPALDRARHHADAWLDSLATRAIPPQRSVGDLLAGVPDRLPEHGADSAGG